MEKQTVYVAADGHMFKTEAACREYEKSEADRLARLEARPMEMALRRYDRISSEIAYLKSGACMMDDYYTEPTMDNVRHCTTLPRAERLFARAKAAYKEAFTASGQCTRPDRVRVLANTAAVFNLIRTVRRDLLGDLASKRLERRTAFQRYQALKKNAEEKKKAAAK